MEDYGVPDMYVENVFLGRAYTDYNSEYEKTCIDTVKKRYINANIISLPNIEELPHDKQNIKDGKGLFNKEKDHFLKLIDGCDVFVCASINNEFNKDGSKRNDKGKLSKGVRIEALYTLSIGKRVYILDVYGDDVKKLKFREIYSISDSEELIETIVALNREKMLKDFPKMKELMKEEKRLNIHQKMMNFYANNDKAWKLMNYLPYGSRTHYEIGDLRVGKENGKFDINSLVGELHFRKCIFDKGVKDAFTINRETDEIVSKLKEQGKKGKDFKPRMLFDKHVIGVCVVFDIDAPKELQKKVGKVNMFDEKTDWYSEFMELKVAAEEWFQSQGLKCLSSSTGNGFNVTGEPYWFDERDDNLYDFRETIDNVITNINFLHQDKCKGVRIDAYPITWHVYKKMIFTYHAKWNRITFPVSKGVIDKEWIKKMSNLDYFLGERVKENVNGVIEKSNWNTDKWW